MLPDNHMNDVKSSILLHQVRKLSERQVREREIVYVENWMVENKLNQQVLMGII